MTLSTGTESCDKHTSEEEDLLNRSTKKPKPNGVDCSEVIMDDRIDEGSDKKEKGGEDQEKPSYREIHYMYMFVTIQKS
ncbi:hypothetical protein RIF29_31122 [Crotalaria pallida]|uniref:Uncharacterized protein n=1 Tax=Crotalaria pallida TaxID=3830 RepID=A0AAN9EHE7_CROPI